VALQRVAPFATYDIEVVYLTHKVPFWDPYLPDAAQRLVEVSACSMRDCDMVSFEQYDAPQPRGSYRAASCTQRRRIRRD
jgi:hypothetical protein